MLLKFPNNDDTNIVIYYHDRACAGSWNEILVLGFFFLVCYLPTKDKIYIALS